MQQWTSESRRWWLIILFTTRVKAKASIKFKSKNFNHHIKLTVFRVISWNAIYVLFVAKWFFIYQQTCFLFAKDHSSYFEATRERAIVTIRNTTSIPPSVFNQQHILLFLHATRPQTVEASTAIVITLPAGKLTNLLYNNKLNKIMTLFINFFSKQNIMWLKV